MNTPQAIEHIRNILAHHTELDGKSIKVRHIMSFNTDFFDEYPGMYVLYQAGVISTGNSFHNRRFIGGVGNKPYKQIIFINPEKFKRYAKD